MDDLMTDRERLTVARLRLAAFDAREALQDALRGVKVSEEPAGLIGDAVDALMALDALERDCRAAAVRDAALAAVE